MSKLREKSAGRWGIFNYFSFLADSRLTPWGGIHKMRATFRRY